MSKIINFLTIFYISFNIQTCLYAETFDVWLKNFKISAIESGISKDVVEDVMSDVKFLPKVIEYDRFQPEFYEDTFTYVRKRTSRKKLQKV